MEAEPIKASEKNSQEIDLTTPVAPSIESAKPARFAIVPANAEKEAVAII